jgi:hypothetical protein
MSIEHLRTLLYVKAHKQHQSDMGKRQRSSRMSERTGLCVHPIPDLCEDDWLVQPVRLTRADGTVALCVPGSRMPDGMAISTHVIILPETFIDSVCEPIHIATQLSSIAGTLQEFDECGQAGALFIAVSARRSVDEKFARNDDILARMHGGCETAEREWTDFSNDCVILAAYKIYRGGHVCVVPGTMDKALTTLSRFFPSSALDLENSSQKKCISALQRGKRGQTATKILTVDRKVLKATNP